MKSKTKTRTVRLLAMITALCMICIMMVMPVMAEGEDVGVMTATDDPRESVMLISLGYQDDAGNYYDYKWGTCFLINDEYVLTNKHVVTLTADEFENFKAVFNVPNLAANDSHIKAYLYVNRDMRVNASMHESVNSDDMDFAAMKLAEKIYDRKPVALGDSDQIQTKDAVYALGYPADSISNKEYNTKDDVSMVTGAISKIAATSGIDIIEHTAGLNLGNSGGPLLDDNNSVVGINTFIAGKKNYSIQINAIKKGLDTFGIPYVDGSGASVPDVSDTDNENSEDGEEEQKEDNSAILAALQDVVKEAKAIEANKYTKESMEALDECIGKAETVLSKGTDATEDEILTATDDLNDAITNMEEKSGSNWFLIGGIIAAVVVIIIIVLVIVLSSGKKKKSAKAKVPNGYGAGAVPGAVPMTGASPGTAPMSSQMPEGAGETTLLDAGAGETTLLGGGAGSAYLIRKKNGEKIMINLQNFKIGKERRKVNYCVADNTTVSRLHCEIVKKGADYYVVDLGSANCTYVNGVQASPHKDTLLTNQSVLKLSDEEFEFHLS